MVTATWGAAEKVRVALSHPPTTPAVARPAAAGEEEPSPVLRVRVSAERAVEVGSDEVGEDRCNQHEATASRKRIIVVAPRPACGISSAARVRLETTASPISRMAPRWRMAGGSLAASLVCGLERDEGSGGRAARSFSEIDTAHALTAPTASVVGLHCRSVVAPMLLRPKGTPIGHRKSAR